MTQKVTISIWVCFCTLAVVYHELANVVFPSIYAVIECQSLSFEWQPKCFLSKHPCIRSALVQEENNIVYRPSIPF
jgi:hypothetical protein